MKKYIIGIFFILIISFYVSPLATFAQTYMDISRKEIENGVLTIPTVDKNGISIDKVLCKQYEKDNDLKVLIIQNNITHIEPEAFKNCSNLNHIDLPDSLQSIGSNAFLGTSFYDNPANWDEDGVLYIENCLIAANPNVFSAESYTVKPGTRLIADCAFAGCRSLKKISFPNSIQYVGSGVLVNTPIIEEQSNYTDGILYVDHIAVRADKENASGNILIQEGTKVIADAAFENCHKIDSITFPDSIEAIQDFAFWDCSSMQKVHLGANIKTIGFAAFSGCDELERFSLSDNNRYFSLENGILLNKERTKVIKCPDKKTGVVILPESVQSINPHSFWWCQAISEVVIPESCSYIGESAFAYCCNLVNISLPETLKYIGARALSYTDISKINIPDGVVYIGPYAFECCLNLRSVKVGNGIKQISDGLFLSCEKLAEVDFGNSIQTIAKNAFFETNFISNAENYKDNLLIVSEKYLIKGVSSIENCKIPENVEIVADGAFYNENNSAILKTITLPSNLKRFSWAAFKSPLENNVKIYSDNSRNELQDKADFCIDDYNVYTGNFHCGILYCVIIFLAAFILLTIVIIFDVKMEETKND